MNTQKVLPGHSPVSDHVEQDFCGADSDEGSGEIIKKVSWAIAGWFFLICVMIGMLVAAGLGLRYLYLTVWSAMH